MWGHAAFVQTGELVFWRLDETYGCPARYTAGEGPGPTAPWGRQPERFIRHAKRPDDGLRVRLVLSSHTRAGGNPVRVTASGRVAELTGMVCLLLSAPRRMITGPSPVSCDTPVIRRIIQPLDHNRDCSTRMMLWPGYGPILSKRPLRLPPTAKLLSHDEYTSINPGENGQRCPNGGARVSLQVFIVL